MTTQNQESEERTRKGYKKVNKRATKIVVIVVAAILAVVSIAGCSGGNATEVITTAQLQQKIDEQNAVITGLQNAVANAAATTATQAQLSAAIAGVNDTVKTTQTQLTAAQAQLAALQTQLAALPPGVTQAQVQAITNPISQTVTELQAKLAALTTRVTNLETPPADAPAKVTATIKYLFPSLTYSVNYPVTAPQAGTFRLDITNSGSTTAKDVQLMVYFVQSGATVNYSPAPNLTNPVAVGGTPLIWQYGGVQSGAILFASGLGLNLAAGETRSISLTLTLQSADTGSVQYTPYVFVN